MKALYNKKILLGITGGIAAYKSAEIAHDLRKAGAEVKVAMTPAATQFITPLTLQALSGNSVATGVFEPNDTSGMDHIDLARWPDAILIAPATANCIAQLAHGLTQDLLSTLCLASTKPIFLAPAMNQNMWLNPATQANVQKIQENGIKLLGPAEGIQACGDNGPGRMLEPRELLSHLENYFSNEGLLHKQEILITAGPTREPIDPVRYLSNRSSGKMGYALAEAASNAGANVTLISGPTHISCPNNVLRIQVSTAAEMHDAVIKNLPGKTHFISTAAVADYRPQKQADHKIKKTENTFTLELKRTVDILKQVTTSSNGLITIGFAAETDHLLENAHKKLLEKNLDAIIANSVGHNHGFDSDENEATLFWKNGNLEHFPLMPKSTLAAKLIEAIARNTGSACPDTKALQHKSLQSCPLI